MKKALPITVLSLSPILIGYLSTVLIKIPAFSRVLPYILPLVMLFYWFWAGRKFAQLQVNPILSVIYSHTLGLLSLFLYLFEFHYLSGLSRNTFLCEVSQYFTAPVVNVTYSFAAIFEPIEHVTTQVTFSGGQILSFIILLLVFIFGYKIEMKYSNV